MENLKVSIIIPAYNAGNFIEKAIQSALKQTYKNIEILVVNDGSKDNGETKSVCDKYKDKIKYFEKENGGCASALNFGIEKSEGDLISWLSHDDLYSEDKIEKEVEQYQKHYTNENDIAIACWSDNVDLNDNIIKRKVKKFSKKFQPRDALKYLLSGGNFNGLGLLIPRSVFGKFDENYKYILDWEMWIRLASHGLCFYLMNDTLVFNRKHKNQVSEKQKQLFAIETKTMANHLLVQFAENNDTEMCLEICYLLFRLNLFDKEFDIFFNEYNIKYSKIKAFFIKFKFRLINIIRKVLKI